MLNPTKTLFAVVQTGCVTQDATIVPYTTRDGTRTPAILFTHEDYDRCVRQRKRMLTLFARHRQFAGATANDMQLATPILGVVQITSDQPVKRVRPLVPATLPNGSPPTSAEPTPEQSAPRGRKSKVVGGEVPLPV